MDRIRNEYIRGTAQAVCFGDKVGEARSRWFGNVQKRKAKEEVYASNKRGQRTEGNTWKVDDWFVFLNKLYTSHVTQ